MKLGKRQEDASMSASMSEQHILALANRYMWSLRAVQNASSRGLVDLTAVHACLLLALRENDLANLSRFENSYMAEELDEIERYVAGYYPEQYEAGEQISAIAIKLLQDQSTMIKARTDRIWELEAEAANFQGLLDLAYARPGAFGGAPQASEPAGVNGDGGHSTEVLGPALELSPEEKSGILWAATAQLATEAARLANSAPDAIDYSSLVTVSAPAAVEWAGLPEEYWGEVIGMRNGAIGWTDITVPARRSIALSVIGKMATDGNLTQADYDNRRPAYMPTASAIAKMFGIRWTSIVQNAVSVGAAQP